MIKFDPKQAISLFVKTSATAIAAANGADPETAAIAGDAAEAITGGISFEKKKSAPMDAMRNATADSIEKAFSKNGVELTEDFRNELVETIFSPDALSEMFSAREPETVFEDRINSAFEHSAEYDTSTLPLREIIGDIVWNLDNAIKNDTALSVLDTRHDVKAIRETLQQLTDKPEDLKTFLANQFIRTRDNHPSFVLLRKDGIDKRLFPQAKELKQFEAMGKTKEDRPVSPVWSIIRQSWTSGEKRNVVIEGAGGIGKTVTLFSAANIKDGEIPPAVYVPMHGLIDKDGNCIKLSVYLEEIHKGINDLVKQEWTNVPQILVMLDGFNEVTGKQRRSLLSMINKWYKSNPGVQIIAVSRKMDGMDLKSELIGKPLAITLEPLSQDTVRKHLGDRAPDESSSVWEVLTLPLFLNLFIRTEGLEGCTSDGYALAPKKAESGGALIWNYLQRELLKIDREDWVLRCAVACEYILPYIAYRMEREHRFTIERDRARNYIKEAVDSIDPDRLPCHLTDIFGLYDDRYDKDLDLNAFDWERIVFKDVGLLKKNGKSYGFIHHNFRDALAGLYLVNQAEMMKDGEPLPEVWRRAANHYVMDYAAELMDEPEADRLWEANRIRRPTGSTATYAMMELQRRRFDGKDSRLNFSGMDLRGISLSRYFKSNELSGVNIKLFCEAETTVDTIIDECVFYTQGHSISVYSVVVTKDGLCVSASGDKTMRVWDVHTGECLRVLEGHTAPVFNVALLNDRYCISCAYDETLRVWKLDTAECVHTIHSVVGKIRCIAAKENQCIVGTSEGCLYVMDLESEQIFKMDGHHTVTVRCIAVTDDGYCISGLDDGTILVWELQTGKCVKELKEHVETVRCISVTKDGICISGSDDCTLRIWDIYAGKCVRTLEGHSGPALCVEILGERCISGSSDNTLKVWNIQTGKCERTMKGHNGRVNCVTTIDNHYCVSGSDDNTLRIWNTTTGKLIRVLEGNARSVICTALLNGNRCVSGSYDSVVRIWNTNTGKCLHHLKGHSASVNCVAKVDDSSVVSGSRDCTLRIWNTVTGKSKHILKGHSGSVRCVAVTMDDHCISGSIDGTLRVWDIRKGKFVRSLIGHTHWINCIAITQDNRCVSGSDDKSIRVWDYSTGECLRTISNLSSWVNCIAMIDPNTCISGLWDGSLQLWNINTGECLCTFMGHTDSVNCVAVINKVLFVTGSDDRTIRIWDKTSSEALYTINDHAGWVNCFSSSDSNLCISGSWDGTMRIWELNIKNPKESKCIDVLYPLEIDVSNMDLSKAVLTRASAKALWQNGAKISDSDYKKYIDRTNDNK